MIGFGKESPFLPGRLRDQFNALSYSKKEQFEHIADEVFSHFHQIGDVAGMKYLLNGIIAQRTNGPIEFFAGHMETLLVGSDCSIMIKVRDLETIKEFIERDDGFSLGGRGSGTRYRSGLSHAANEAALWYLIGRDNTGFTASDSKQASAEIIGKIDTKLESYEQQNVPKLDQWIPAKLFFGLFLLFAFMLVLYVEMKPASSRMTTPMGAPSPPTDSASALEAPSVSPQQTEPNETDERVHEATYSSEPYGANIIIDGWDYGRGPVTLRYTVPPDLADGDKF